MKYDKMLPADHRDGDDLAMRTAIDILLQHDIDVRRPNNNAYQLKIASDLSFYPGKGTIVRDGSQGRLPENGIDAAIKLASSDRKRR